MLQSVAQLQKRLKLCDFFDFCYFGLMDKISMKSMVLVPPNIDFSLEIMIFPNFESLYLHDTGPISESLPIDRIYTLRDVDLA